MIGLCKDCKWWRQQFFQETHFCALHLQNSRENKGVERLAYADGYGDVHWLITEPEFGCVQFEEK